MGRAGDPPLLGVEISGPSASCASPVPAPSGPSAARYSSPLQRPPWAWDERGSLGVPGSWPGAFPLSSGLDRSDARPPGGLAHLHVYDVDPPPGFWGLTATLRWPRRWRDMQPLLCLGPHPGGGAPSLRAGAGGGGPRFAFQWVFMNPPAHTQKTLSVLHGRNFSFSTEARTAVIVPLNVQMFLPLPPPTTVWLVTT